MKKLIISITSAIVLISIQSEARTLKGASFTRFEIEKINAFTRGFEALDFAEDYHQWGEEVESLKRQFEDLEQMDTSLKRSICRNFQGLKIEEKVTLTTILEATQELPCKVQIQKEVDSYFESREVYASKLFGIEYGRSALEEDFKLPVVDFEVPVNEGPFYVHAGLERGYIAITVDDGPHPTRTQRLLDIFEEFQAKATFFMVGQKAYTYPEIAREVRLAGHSVGSHSLDHSDLRRKSREDAMVNIIKGHTLVNIASQGVLPFFRFPYGSMSREQKQDVSELPMANFFWNIDTLDWKIKDPVELVKYTRKQIEKAGHRGIILFHDVQEQTVRAMPLILRELALSGYTLVLFKAERSERVDSSDFDSKFQR